MNTTSPGCSGSLAVAGYFLRQRTVTAEAAGSSPVANLLSRAVLEDAKACFPQQQHMPFTCRSRRLVSRKGYFVPSAAFYVVAFTFACGFDFCRRISEAILGDSERDQYEVVSIASVPSDREIKFSLFCARWEPTSNFVLGVDDLAP